MTNMENRVSKPMNEDKIQKLPALGLVVDTLEVEEEDDNFIFNMGELGYVVVVVMNEWLSCCF